MPRSKRVFASGVAYHVICRGSGRSVIFRDPSDYEKYLAMLYSIKQQFKVDVFHYCLMPNHVHLIVRTSTTNGSDFMKKLNLTFSRYVCKKRKKIGHIWKNRFRNIPIESDAYLLACGNYIEMNPVRAKITSQAAEWPYSSHRYYAKGEKDEIVDIDPLYADFGKTPEERMETYSLWMGKTRASEKR